MLKPMPSFAALAVLAASLIAPNPAFTLGTGSFERVVVLAGHSCTFTAFHDAASQETQVNFTPPGTIQSQSSGGNYWLGGVITSWPGGDILSNSIETSCGISGITNFVSDGANGTFAADDFVGVSFRGTSDANGLVYDYVFGASGVATTALVNSRTEVANIPATADAGPDQIVASGATVTLDGSGSAANDPGQTLTYAWNQTSGTTVTLVGGTTINPSFEAPTLAVGGPDATLVFSLVVNDGPANSVPDTVSITVNAPPNIVPTANAGPDQIVASGATVTLDGSGSAANDPGQTLTYAWNQTSGTTVTLVGGTTINPSFEAPTLAVGGPDATLVFSLVVNDGPANSVPDTVSITVNAPPNIVPTANAGPDQIVASGATVTLDGTGSDANDPGRALTYFWSQTGGAGITLDGATTATPSYTAPVLDVGDPSAVLTFSLVVNNDIAESLADTVVITVVAPADTISPTVTISGRPAAYFPATPFTLTINFSEPVTGFVAADVTVASATVTGLLGSGGSYTAEIVPSGSTAAIDISVAAGVAQDAAGNDNLASAVVTILPNTTGLAEEAIVDVLTARSRALINAQPNLRGFLTGSGFSGFSADVTRGVGAFRLGFDGGRRSWILAQGEWSNADTTELDYFNLTIGSHLYRSDNVLIGAMLQLDGAEATLDVGSFSGIGWLIGPYLVARLPDQPLSFSASILHGQTDNTLTLTGQAPDDFSSTRTLITTGIEGRFTLNPELTLIPMLDLAHVADRQDAYVDSLGNLVSAQTIRLTETSFGFGFEGLILADSANILLTGGVSGIYSETDAPGDSSNTLRGRLDLGAEIDLGVNTTARISTYYDGIGRDDYEAFGVAAVFEVRF